MRISAMLSTADSAGEKNHAARARTSRAGTNPSLTTTGRMLQRTPDCACGGGCPRCESQVPALTLQAKLKVSTPGDEYEQEADRVAEQVMSIREPGSVAKLSTAGRASNTLAQRKCSTCEEEPDDKSLERSIAVRTKAAAGQTPRVNSEVSAQIDSLRGGGEPLPESSRAFFEPRFGRDLSGVRIHSNAIAAESARTLNALAYTVGQDIVFGAGQYAPAREDGRRLLAHELTHVLQQGGQTEPQVQRQAAGPSPAPVAGASQNTVSLSEGFSTSRDAAFAALTLCNPKSILSGERPGSVYGLEYGGLIYTLGGKFFFTEPIEGEEGHVDVWRALSQVPPEARGSAKVRGSVVGDYHTHGSGKSASGMTTGEGEDFSGFHSNPLASLIPSLSRSADIGGTRADVATRMEIQNPVTYTAYLGTPQGRFALFTPGRNIVFSFSPDSRLLPLDQKIPSGAAIDDHPLVVMSESGRQKILDAALKKLMNLQNRMLDNDPSLKGFDSSKPNSGINPEDSKTIRTISREMAVYPNSLDWLHDNSADRFFEVLRILTILYLENRNLSKSHVVKSTGACARAGTMARAETPMALCRAFFDIGKEYSDNWCPGLILTHEYFHYLNEPRSGAHIQHADNISMAAADWERRVANAYSLSDLAIQLALGREVSCQLESPASP